MVSIEHDVQTLQNEIKYLNYQLWDNQQYMHDLKSEIRKKHSVKSTPSSKVDKSTFETLTMMKEELLSTKSDHNITCRRLSRIGALFQQKFMKCEQELKLIDAIHRTHLSEEISKKNDVLYIKIKSLEDRISYQSSYIIEKDITLKNTLNWISDLERRCDLKQQKNDQLNMIYEDLLQICYRLQENDHTNLTMIYKLTNERDQNDSISVNRINELVSTNNYWYHKAISLSKHLRSLLKQNIPMEKELYQLRKKLEEVEVERAAYREAMILSCLVNTKESNTQSSLTLLKSLSSLISTPIEDEPTQHPSTTHRSTPEDCFIFFQFYCI